MTIKLLVQTLELDDATRLAALGFVVQHSPELREAVRDHLDDGELNYAVFDDDRPVGFAAFRRYGDTLYLGGIIIDPAYQALGLAGQVITAARARTGARYLALRTQSPRMYAALRKVVGADRCFPHPSLPTPPAVQVCRAAMAERLGMSAPTEPGCYGQALYGEKPLHHDAVLQAFFDRLCDFAAGDAVICVGEFSPPL